MLRYSEWNAVPIWFLYSSVLIVVRWADLIQAKTFRAFEAFIVAAAVYYVLVMILTFIGAYFEKKVRISD